MIRKAPLLTTRDHANETHPVSRFGFGLVFVIHLYLFKAHLQPTLWAYSKEEAAFKYHQRLGRYFKV